MTIDIDAIDHIIDHAMSAQHIAGLGLGISQSGRVVYSQGYGLADVASGTSVTADTPFELASCTKTYTAWGVLCLQDQGALSIQDGVGNYVKLEGTNAQKFADVPLANFLSMSGGLEDLGSNTKKWQELLDEALDHGPVSTPGSEFLYSNPSFMLMGAVIHKVSGQCYDQFMFANMLGPSALGLADTIVHTADDTPANLALGYRWDAATGAFVLTPSRPPSSSFSSGAMLSSGRGLAQYMAALDNQEILSAAAYQQLFTVVPLTGTKAGKWALGWASIPLHDGSTGWGKDGGLPGYSSYLLRDPSSGYSVAIATNTTHIDVKQVAEKVLAQLWTS